MGLGVALVAYVIVVVAESVPALDTAPSGCPPLPSFPDSSCTGWRHTGVTLKPSGDLTITVPGTVVDSKDVAGHICVQASHVTIKRTRVRGTISTASGNEATGCPGSYVHNVLIEDVEIVGPWKSGIDYTADELGEMATTVGVAGDGYTCRRCQVHLWGRGFQVNRDVTIEDSYVYDLIGTSRGGRWVGNDGSSHNSCIGGNGAIDAVYRHNNLDCAIVNDQGGVSGAIVLYSRSEFLPAKNVLIKDNLLNGGAYCIYPGVPADPASDPVPTDIRVLGNYFGRALYPKCGSYGPAAGWTYGHGNQWRDNVWADTGELIEIKAIVSRGSQN
ncbi:MAG: hypothetical protein ACRDZO_02535 [Egibacteraceae bacterium]